VSERRLRVTDSQLQAFAAWIDMDEEDRLVAYALGLLDEDEAVRVGAHIAGSDETAQAYEKVRTRLNEQDSDELRRRVDAMQAPWAEAKRPAPIRKLLISVFSIVRDDLRHLIEELNQVPGVVARQVALPSAELAGARGASGPRAVNAADVDLPDDVSVDELAARLRDSLGRGSSCTIRGSGETVTLTAADSVKSIADKLRRAL
jgi:hypothetical protein